MMSHIYNQGNRSMWKSTVVDWCKGLTDYSICACNRSLKTFQFNSWVTTHHSALCSRHSCLFQTWRRHTCTLWEKVYKGLNAMAQNEWAAFPLLLIYTFCLAQCECHHFKLVARWTDLYLLESSPCTPRRGADSNPLRLPVWSRINNSFVS